MAPEGRPHRRLKAEARRLYHPHVHVRLHGGQTQMTNASRRRVGP